MIPAEHTSCYGFSWHRLGFFVLAGAISGVWVLRRQVAAPAPNSVPGRLAGGLFGWFGHVQVQVLVHVQALLHL